MVILENVDLSPYNTMGVSAKARYLSEISSVEELHKTIHFASDNNLEILVLGEGSNLLFVHDFPGLIILNRITGIEVLPTEEDVIIKVGAGENWHELVVHCVKKNWGGIENLSLIPGTVGAAPIQNIGAYGVELTDVFEELEAYMLNAGEVRVFNNEDCQFGYRDSIFKHDLKGRAVVTSVTFRLKKKPEVNTRYAALAQQLEEWGISEPTVQDVSKAVIAVRQSKLPDPREIGNNGSFFKNPVISVIQFEKLQAQYPNIPSYPVSETEIKVPAGWLIDQAGWKGYRKGDAGVHAKQALVLVNYGNASGEDILELSEEIQRDIQEKYRIELEREVNTI